MNNTIRTLEEFRKWVRVQLALKEMTQKSFAREIRVPDTRISEAIHGKPSGDRYVLSIINGLDGNVEDFKEFLKAV